jgi:hypothetical protein
MKINDYFFDETLRKRPFLQIEWCADIIKNPIKTQTQTDGKIRHWGYVPELGKYVRVITLADGTLLNAFPDRRFKP